MASEICQLDVQFKSARASQGQCTRCRASCASVCGLDSIWLPGTGESSTRRTCCCSRRPTSLRPLCCSARTVRSNRNTTVNMDRNGSARQAKLTGVDRATGKFLGTCTVLYMCGKNGDCNILTTGHLFTLLSGCQSVDSTRLITCITLPAREAAAAESHTQMFSCIAFSARARILSLIRCSASATSASSARSLSSHAMTCPSAPHSNGFRLSLTRLCSSAQHRRQQ